MHPVVAHLVSGQVLFTGLPLMMAMILLRERISRPDVRRLVTVMAWCFGLLGISTAAVPWWGLGMLPLSLGIWSVRGWRPERIRLQRFVTVCPVAIACVFLTMEIGWVVRPSMSPVAERSIVVLGDSLSAGLGEGEGTPWPFQLRDWHHVQVHNLSEAGATTADALARIGTSDHFPGVVIVELGGNDLLGGRALTDFERDLDGILAHLREKNRSVAMVELPLLPGTNAWGVVQRQLAQKYHCRLIPKRLLVQVLARPGATVDTLHLSQLGHRELAETIWSVVGQALPESSPQ